MQQMSNSGDPFEPVQSGSETPLRLRDPDDTVAKLNSLLRGEISAVETYRMAIERAQGSEHAASHVAVLHEIHLDHGRAAQRLRARITSHGGEASDHSGVWGGWAKLVQGSANMLGDLASLKALKEGEEHGLRDYRDGLSDLDDVSCDLIEFELIPSQQRHIDLLDQMMSSTSDA